MLSHVGAFAVLALPFYHAKPPQTLSSAPYCTHRLFVLGCYSGIDGGGVMRTAEQMEWISEASQLRRLLAEKPKDTVLLARADALVKRARQIGIQQHYVPETAIKSKNSWWL